MESLETQAEAEKGLGLWETLAERASFANYVPRPGQAEGGCFTTRDGREYYILKSRQGSYLRLSTADYALWELMDGSRPVKSIAVEYFLKYHRLALARLAQLVEELRAKGFLLDKAVDLFGRLQRWHQQRSFASRANALVGLVMNRSLGHYSGADQLFERWYKGFGWLFFTRSAQSFYLALVGAGILLWFWEFASGSYSLFQTAGSYFWGLITLLILDNIALVVHETAHGLATKHYGRQVHRVGIMLFYLMPTFYVDTSDVWLAPRRARIAVSWAGPYSTLVFAGAFAIVAAFFPDTLIGNLAFQAATLWMLDMVMNMTPLIEVDGYYMLMDYLEIPLLRAKSLAFLRRDFLPKVAKRQPFSHEEKVFTLFGVLSLVWSGLIVALALWFWQKRVGYLAQDLGRRGYWYAKPLFFLLLAIFAGPLVIAILGKTYAAAAWVKRWATRALERWRKALPEEDLALLRGLSFLQELKLEQLAALSSHLRREEFGPGQVVIREGDEGDSFYLIRSGQAEVYRGKEEGFPVHVATLTRGDYFGEIALIRRVRRTASVRALTRLQIFSLDRGHFHRWLAETLAESDTVGQRLIDRARLRGWPIFATLSPSEVDRLALRLRLESFAPGQTIIRQGEVGEKFYILAQGQAEVVEERPGGQEERLALLGEGDFFGEIALLKEVPRTATVRALAQVEVYSLHKADFLQLLGQIQELAQRVKKTAEERLHPLAA